MRRVSFLLFMVGGIGISVASYCAIMAEKPMISERINSVEAVKALFPQTPQEIQDQTERYLGEAEKAIAAIVAIPAAERTFANTAQALSNLGSRSNIAVKEGAIEIIEYLCPDKEMRDAAHEAIQKVQVFFVDHVGNNKQLYEAFKSYAEGNATSESLSDEERYYLQETMKGFKRAGLDRSLEELEIIKDLNKRLQKRIQEFDRNIASDTRTICVPRKALAGLDDAFIAQLKTNEDGSCFVGVDYPTYIRIMDCCTIESTRKALYEAFSNRAYPANHELLQEIISLRDELAHALGFESYAALNLESQMVGTPERAEAFVTDICKRARTKEDCEFNALLKELPESVSLTADGKIKLWDQAFLKNQYKKKYLSIDEEKIAEYFPMQKTLDALLDIYRTFLSVDFKEMPVSGLWHEDVRLIKLCSKDGSCCYGYIILDLYPRPYKYSHAAHAGIVPAILLPDGKRLPAVSVVMANFTKPSKDKPSLLLRNEVQTFFHEFGHALHSQLGATQLGSCAGTRVKTDFVEMPSQMLEEWLWDKDILKKVSSHYQTGAPLSDEQITNILALKRYDSGSFVVRQAMLALYSLNLYKSGAKKDPYQMLHALVAEHLPRTHYGAENRFYASFGHLTGYGPKYYGYLWSKVFALDLFETIREKGLLNPEIGERYVREVIGRGGSADPNTLLRNFLEREPRLDAFIRDLGLDAA